MTILLTAIHVVVCIFLIFVVLLQSAQAADLAGAFGGGGSQTALGMRSATTLLQKATTVAAIVFMLTSLALGLAERSSTSVIEGLDEPAVTSPQEAAPGEQAPGEQSGEQETAEPAASGSEGEQAAEEDGPAAQTEEQEDGGGSEQIPE
jgi:preprotein translocase subunit SecG